MLPSRATRNSSSDKNLRMNRPCASIPFHEFHRIQLGRRVHVCDESPDGNLSKWSQDASIDPTFPSPQRSHEKFREVWQAHSPIVMCALRYTSAMIDAQRCAHWASLMRITYQLYVLQLTWARATNESAHWKRTERDKLLFWCSLYARIRRRNHDSALARTIRSSEATQQVVRECRDTQRSERVDDGRLDLNIHGLRTHANFSLDITTSARETWLEGSGFCQFATHTPTIQVLDGRCSTASGNHPGHLIVAVVDLLMLCPGGNQSEITRGQILTPLPTFRDNCTVTPDRIDNCVLLTVMMNCGRGMRLCYHH